MRRRSMTGPLLLLLIGCLFLWRNIHPEAPVFDMVAQYWPFVLIAWGLIRLFEVVVLDQRRSPSVTGGEVVLVVFICVIGSGMWEGRRHGFHFNTGSLDVFGETYDYPVSAEASAGGMKRITFENPRGNIKVIGGDTDQITVTGHKTIRAYNRADADKANGNTPIEIVPQADRLLIRTNQEHTPDNQRVADDLEVTVPRAMAVESRARTGDFEVNDVQGDVELITDRGDVRLSRIGGNARLEVGRSEVIRAIDVQGKLDIQGRGSDLELQNVQGQVTISGSYLGSLEFKNLAKPLQFEGALNTELHVQGVPGTLSMNRSEVAANGVTGPVRLVTRSRDIRLEGFTQSLELETERGDVQLQPSLPMPEIQARSGYGRIELVLPDKAHFDLEATAERGEAFSEVAGIEQTRRGRTSVLRGRTGDGPTVRITANRGSITVRKEGSSSELPPAPARAPNPPKMPKVPAEVRM